MASLLGLVSYGGSDSEEEEEEERGGTGKLNETSDKDTTILKKTPLLKHEKDKSGKVRVYLPDFNKKANTTTGSSTDLHKEQVKDDQLSVRSKPLTGLMSVLPQPKKRKSTSSSAAPSAPPPPSKRPSVGASLFKPHSLKKNKMEPVEEESNDNITSFLFLEDDDEEDKLSLPTDYSTNISSDQSISTSSLSPYANIHQSVTYPSASSLPPPPAPPPTGSDAVHNISQDPGPDDNLPLDDDIVRRLAGKRRGQRLDDEAVSLSQVKSVTENDLKDSVKAYQKYSTEQAANSGTVPENLVYSSEGKRKHQITWLAHQAKSREVELKNFWAESATLRRQTKMKYGF